MNNSQKSCSTLNSERHLCASTLADLWVRFYMFPHHIETTSFGVSCDAFSNLKETLTRHKSMVAEYLDKNYDRVRFSLFIFLRSG